MDEMTPGKRLQVARKTAGIRTQQELADFLGISEKTVRNWETDVYPVPAEYRPRLRAKLGPFDDEGDPVEAALRRSGLVDWRRKAVESEYQRHQYEQGQERRGSA